MRAKPVVLVVGAGDYIGSAIAERFARGGYQIVAARRNKTGVRNLMRNDMGDEFDRLPPDTLMSPSSTGEVYWFLHQQPRDGWTFELDLRPFAEKW